MVSTLIKHKPTTPGKRGEVSIRNKDLTKPTRKSKSLRISKVNSSGRNNAGRITNRRMGGGHKQAYRIVDFKRNKDNIPAKVEALEYDPNRSADLALLLYADGERKYIIAPKGLKVGDIVESGRDVAIKVGYCLPMTNMPVGTVIHCIELKIKKGAQIARSAGCSAQLLAKEGNYATLRLKSGEMRKVLLECRATVGEVGRGEHSLVKLGKAGRSRWKNRRPTVRGVAMNPVDHPMGGGEGKTSGGRPPCSPWGQVERKTRAKKKPSTKLIVRKRKRKSEKK